MHLLNDQEIWLSHRIHVRSLHFGIPQAEKVILTGIWNKRDRGKEKRHEQHIWYCSSHNGWL